MQLISSLFSSSSAAPSDGSLPEGHVIPFDGSGKRNVRIVSKIGEGGFAMVYLSEDCSDKSKRYAVKHSKCMSDDQKQCVEREIKVMQDCGIHPNLVSFYGSTQRTTRLTEYFILLEFMDSSLMSVLRARSKGGRKDYLAERSLLEMWLDISRGLSHLHSLGWAHRDIKVENILMTTPDSRIEGSVSQLKLCDFGSCVSGVPYICESSREIGLEAERIERLTTPEYRAPEMIDLYQRRPLSTAVDIWALGCVFFITAFLCHAFPDGAKMAILDARYTPFPTDHPYSKKITRLIKLCFQKDPNKRPTAAQICNHLKSLLSGGKGTLSKSSTKDGSGKSRKKKSQSVVGGQSESMLKSRDFGASAVSPKTPVIDRSAEDDDDWADQAWDDVFDDEAAAPSGAAGSSVPASAADASAKAAAESASDALASVVAVPKSKEEEDLGAAGLFWDNFGDDLVDGGKDVVPQPPPPAAKKPAAAVAVGVSQRTPDLTTSASSDELAEGAIEAAPEVEVEIFGSARIDHSVPVIPSALPQSTSRPSGSGVAEDLFDADFDDAFDAFGSDDLAESKPTKEPSAPPLASSSVGKSSSHVSAGLVDASAPPADDSASVAVDASPSAPPEDSSASVSRLAKPSDVEGSSKKRSSELMRLKKAAESGDASARAQLQLRQQAEEARKKAAEDRSVEKDLKSIYADKIRDMADMGFTDADMAAVALQQANGDVTLAIHFLVSQMAQ